MNLRAEKIRTNERGIVAIFVVSMLMIVISLTVFGFAQVIMREQRQALDQQLNSQAFYAAESGVNLARKNINAALIAGTPLSKPNCDPDPIATNPYGSDNYKVDDSTGAQITCLIVKDNLQKYDFQNVDNHPKMVQLKRTDGLSIPDIYVAWQNPANTTGVSGCSVSVPAGNSFGTNTGAGAGLWNCAQPLLRIDVVPIGNGTNLDLNALSNNQFTNFLYPITGGANPTPINWASGTNPASLGTVTGVRCSVVATLPRFCAARITPPVLSPSISYAVRVMAFYGSADVSLWVASANPTLAPTLTGGVVQVDVTAKARDVIRRIQVQIPASGGPGTTPPPFALSAGNGICKRYSVTGLIVSPVAPASDPNGTCTTN